MTCLSIIVGQNRRQELTKSVHLFKFISIFFLIQEPHYMLLRKQADT